MKHALSAALGLVALTLSGSSRAEGDLVLELGGGTSLELKRIPKGTFVQGSPPTDLLREPDETARTVSIAHDFWLGKTPVTKGQFARFVSETRYLTEAEKGSGGGHGWDGKQLYQKKDFNWKNPGFPQTMDDPVVLVSFGDANAFTAWLARKTGRRVRLPSEAEWEYSARAGTSTPWYGAVKDDDALALGWFVKNAGQGTHPVGQKKPNAFGLFDMTGDVYQWCRDVYAPYPPGNAVDPENIAHASAEEKRVLRGGSWLRDPRRGRSSARFRSGPGSRSAEYGFRIAAHDEDALAPGVPAGSADFAPASPLGLGSSSPLTAPLPGGDASADAAAAVVRPAPEGTGWSLLAAPAAAAGAVVLWMLARRKRVRTPVSSTTGISTRAESDGFWVRAPSLSAGARVRYTCIVDGAEVTDIVPIDSSDETFVYTRGRPTAIRVVETFAATRGGYRTTQATQPASPPPPPSSSGLAPPPSSTPISPRRPPPPVPTSSSKVAAASPPPVPTSSSKVAAASPPPVPTSSSKVAAASPPPSSRRNEDLPPEPIEPESIETIEPPAVIVPTMIQTIGSDAASSSASAPSVASEPPASVASTETEAETKTETGVRGAAQPAQPSAPEERAAESAKTAEPATSTIEAATPPEASTGSSEPQATSSVGAPAESSEADASSTGSTTPPDASSTGSSEPEASPPPDASSTGSSEPEASPPPDASSTGSSEPEASPPPDASSTGSSEPEASPPPEAAAPADSRSEAPASVTPDGGGASDPSPAASPSPDASASQDSGATSDEKPGE